MVYGCTVLKMRFNEIDIQSIDLLKMELGLKTETA